MSSRLSVLGQKLRRSGFGLHWGRWLHLYEYCISSSVLKVSWVLLRQRKRITLAARSRSCFVPSQKRS